MTFTDDNKKQVEEVLQMSSAKTIEISKSILIALLARMEAAENIIENDSSDEAYEAWRKSKGEKE